MLAVQTVSFVCVETLLLLVVVVVVVVVVVAVLESRRAIQLSVTVAVCSCVSGWSRPVGLWSVLTRDVCLGVVVVVVECRVVDLLTRAADDFTGRHSLYDDEPTHTDDSRTSSRRSSTSVTRCV